MGLAAVGIAECNVHAGEFFVLQQDADHPRKPEVGAERQLADTVAVLVGVAITPEFVFQILARAFGADQTTTGDLKHQRRALQIAVFSVEVIASGCIADEWAIHRAGRGQNFAPGQIRTVARADEAPGLYPIHTPPKYLSNPSPPLGLPRNL